MKAVVATLGLLISLKVLSLSIIDCPECNSYTWQNNYLPNNYLSYSFGMPWWAMQGSMMYSNFYYPGPWVYQSYNQGINGNYYPGEGGAHLLKPNIYLSGPSGARLKLNFELAPETNLIATMPSYDQEKGWDITLGQDGEVLVENVGYPYLFYDFRTDHNFFQYEAGHCVDKRHLVSFMAEILKELGFVSQEIEDFVSHWNYKIPRAAGYCVYPQKTSLVDRAVKLKVKEPSVVMTRIIFMLVPFSPYVNSRPDFFPPIPKKKYRPEVVQVPDEKMLQIREWGVGFLDISLP